MANSAVSFGVIEHNVSHQHGEDDEINVTELVGAGAPTMPYEDIYYDILTTSLDLYYTYNSGSGIINAEQNRIEMITGVTPGSVCYIQKEIGYPHAPITWDKDRKFRIYAQVICAGDNKIKGFLGIGDYPGGKYTGFLFDTGKLYGTSRTGGSADTVELADYGAGFDETHLLQLIFTTGTKVEFYIDGTKKGELTTNLPTGTSDAKLIPTLYIENPGTNQSKTIYFSGWAFYQEV